MPTRSGEADDRRYANTTMVRAAGYVYCHIHGSVHDATTDPFDSPDDKCHRKEHRPVYYRARKGDWR